MYKGRGKNCDNRREMKVGKFIGNKTPYLRELRKVVFLDKEYSSIDNYERECYDGKMFRRMCISYRYHGKMYEKDLIYATYFYGRSYA